MVGKGVQSWAAGAGVITGGRQVGVERPVAYEAGEIVEYANLVQRTHETRCTRGDDTPRIALRTEPIVDIQVEVPGLCIDSPEETLDLRDDGLRGEHLEAEHKADGMGPVHLVGTGDLGRGWTEPRGAVE